MTEVTMHWGYNARRSRHEWQATMPNGEVRVSTDWEGVHDMVRRLVPDVKFEYTNAGWQRNVSEFNHSLRRRR